MTRRRRAPRPAGQGFERSLKHWMPDTLLAEIQVVWPRVAGARMAAAGRPTAERGGLLTISCGDAVWAQELSLMAPTLLERLNPMLTRGRVERIRVIAVAPDDRG